MAFYELKTLSRDLYLAKQIEQLRIVYSSAQKKILSQLKSVDLTDFGRARANQILHQTDKIIKSLDKQTYKWAKATMPASYDRGIDLSAERLKALGVTRFVNYDAQIHTQAVSILVDDVTRELLVANDGMRGSLNSVIHKSQQAIIQDREISRRIAEGMITGEPRRAISSGILKDLRTNMREERFISIKGRNYRPDKYAEMVARTRTREASSEGTVNTALRYGVDLVQWDAHSDVCEICQYFSGRIFSISGNHPDFPPLREKPPVHPRCRCGITPITEENLEKRGEYDSMVKLSNSNTIPIPSYNKFREVVKSL
jgi:SPP1 gp7 family putative phage head morphogenesis protein